MAVVNMEGATFSAEAFLVVPRLGPNKAFMDATFSAEAYLDVGEIRGKMALSATFPAEAFMESPGFDRIIEMGAEFLGEAWMTASSAVILEMPEISFRIRSIFKASLDQGRDGQGVCNVLDAIFAVWGIAVCASKGPALARREALDKLNQALQLMWNQAEERNYWTNEEIEIAFAGGVDAFVFPDNVQNVVGTVRLKDSRRPLTLIGSLSELEQFSGLYLNGTTTIEPIGFHVQRGRQAGNDPAKVTLRLAPAPLSATDILVEVVKEAPRYGANDIDNCTRIPIPHKYIESLLTPLCRWLAMSSIYFTNKEAADAIMLESAEARRALGLADPLPGKSGDNYRRRREGAA